MASTARLGSFEDLLRELPANTAPHVIPTAKKLREVILDDFPEAIEVVRLDDKAAAYGLGPKKMSESHVYIMPKAKYVNLGFWHGVALPDPDRLLEGTGKKMRHVKIHSEADAEKTAIKVLVTAALEERRTALGYS